MKTVESHLTEVFHQSHEETLRRFLDSFLMGMSVETRRLNIEESEEGDVLPVLVAGGHFPGGRAWTVRQYLPDESGYWLGAWKVVT